jgi:molybdate transport system substrate-binding protein
MIGIKPRANSVKPWTALLALVLGAAAVVPAQATAADLKLLAGSSMRTLLPEVLSKFEKSSGHKVAIEYGTLGAIADRVTKGDAGNVVVVAPAQNEKLQNDGKLLAGSAVSLAKVGYRVFMRKDAVKPALATVDAFKGTVLAAKSIVLGDPAGGGPVGVYSAANVRAQ